MPPAHYLAPLAAAGGRLQCPAAARPRLQPPAGGRAAGHRTSGFALLVTPIATFCTCTRGQQRRRRWLATRSWVRKPLGPTCGLRAALAPRRHALPHAHAAHWLCVHAATSGMRPVA